VVYKVVSSPYTAIVLIALLIILSAYGTLLAPSPAKGFASLYSSPLFTALFSLLALNLFFCSLRRFPSVYRQFRNARPPRTPDFYKRQKFSFIAHVPEEQKEKTLEELPRLFPINATYGDNEGFLLQRGVLNRMGSYILHMGILLILFSGLIRFILMQVGYVVPRGRIVVAETETVNHFLVPVEDKETGKLEYKERPLGFSLRCLDFDEVKYPGSEIPESYSSVVEVDPPGKKRIHTIDMTTPLKFKGFKIHQVDFNRNPTVARYLVELEKREYPGESVTVDLSPGIPVPVQFSEEETGRKLLLTVKGVNINDAWKIEGMERYDKEEREVLFSGRVEVPAGAYSFTPTLLVPDFKMDADMRVYTASEEFNNPAVHILVSRNSEPLSERWCFFNEEFRGIGGRDGDMFDFEFLDYDAASSVTRSSVTIKVSTRTDQQELGTYSLGINEQQAIFYPLENYNDQTTPSTTAVTGDDAFSVKVLRPVHAYTTVLGISREPTTMLTFLGGIIIVAGAFFIYFITYYRIAGLFDSASQTLYLALVCRNPSRSILRHWQHTIDKFDFLKEKNKSEPNPL